MRYYVITVNAALSVIDPDLEPYAFNRLCDAQEKLTELRADDIECFIQEVSRGPADYVDASELANYCPDCYHKMEKAPSGRVKCRCREWSKF